MLCLAQNTPETVWRPGSARTRWGSLSAPPDPLAAAKGLGPPGGEVETWKRRGRGGRRGEGREGREREGREEVHNLRKTTPRHQMAGYGPVQSVSATCDHSTPPISLGIRCFVGPVSQTFARKNDHSCNKCTSIQIERLTNYGSTTLLSNTRLFRHQ